MALSSMLLASIIGCGGTPTAAPGSQPPGSSGSPASAGPGGSTPIGALPPGQAVDVVIDLDEAKRVEQLVPVEGGTISATGADGTTYVLEIPAGALLLATKIALTPVASVTGMPVGSRPRAVQFSPDGLRLLNPATLTITPTAPVPTDQQLGFAYLADGKDLIAATLDLGSSEVRLSISHFSGAGFTEAAAAVLDAAIAALRGGTIERQLESQLSLMLRRARDAQLLGEPIDPELFAKIDAIHKQYEEQVLKPRFAAMGEDCAEAERAVQTILSYERDRQLLGMGGGETVDSKWPRLFDKAALACVREEFAACVEHHRIFLMLVVYQRVLNFAAEHTLSPATLEEALDLTVKCLTFRLELESTGKLDIPFGGWTSTVEAAITIKYRAEPVGLIGGHGEYVNTSYSLVMGDCGTTTTPGGGTLAVLGLLYEVEAGAPDANGGYPDAGVTDLTLVYSPDNSTEKATVSCPDSPPLAFDIPAWSTSFFDAHVEMLDTGGLKETRWDVSGGELYAEKEWDLPGVADPHGSEKGSFTLYHTPGA